MLGKTYLWMLCFIYLICSCKCQGLEKFVVPMLDNRGAPLVAIVDTTSISSHIVRSIEMPLREIINATIECKINETLKDVKVLSNVLTNINDQNTLQQKVDKRIEDSHIQFTAVKQDIIAKLRKEIEEKISHEILEQMKKVTTTLNTVTKDINEKVKNLTDNVDIIQSELRDTILSVDNNVSNLAGQLAKHSNKLDTFRLGLQELNVNTNEIQEGMAKIKSSDPINRGNAGVIEMTMKTIKEQIKQLNSREDIDVFNSFVLPINYSTAALLTARSHGGTISDGNNFKFNSVLTSDCINDLSSVRRNGTFTCEKGGFYLVSFFLTTNTKLCNMRLYQNTNVIARISKGIDTSYQTQSLLVILKLNIGDTLSVKAENGVYDWGGADSMFSILQLK